MRKGQEDLPISHHDEGKFQDGMKGHSKMTESSKGTSLSKGPS